jgi:Uma2 family endonuclease
MAGRSKVRFKAGDIWDVPDDNLRYEVIDGDLFMTPAPSWKHQSSLMLLGNLIFNWVHPRGLGTIVPAPTGVVLDEENGVQPDLVYIAREHFNIISERGVEGSPDLVVEVLSPSTEVRDRGVKMRRYAAAGIAHYWLLDPRARALEAYALSENGYELAGIHGPGAIFRPALFPGLEIPVDTLWEG